jgi:hypothetical protein
MEPDARHSLIQLPAAKRYRSAPNGTSALWSVGRVSPNLRYDGVEVDWLLGFDLDDGRVKVERPGLRGGPAGDHLVGLMLWEMPRVSIG